MNGECGYKVNVIKSIIMKKVRGCLQSMRCEGVYESIQLNWIHGDDICDDDAAKDGWRQIAMVKSQTTQRNSHVGRECATSQEKKSTCWEILSQG